MSVRKKFFLALALIFGVFWIFVLVAITTELSFIVLIFFPVATIIYMYLFTLECPHCSKRVLKNPFEAHLFYIPWIPKDCPKCKKSFDGKLNENST